MYCKHCGNPVNDDQAICLNCGCETGLGQQQATNGQQPNTAYLNGKDKIAMALLAIFLGGWGIHNFVLGETKKGIVKILLSCCGISAILALIDFILILTDKYVVDPNKYFI